MLPSLRQPSVIPSRRPKLRYIAAALLTTLLVLGFAMSSSATFEPELLRWEWAEAPRVNSSQTCGVGKICVEWCRIYQGHIEEASGRFCCGTPDMIGSEDPRCPGQ